MNKENMMQRIKTLISNYKEKRRRKQILKDIKKAKRCYLKELEYCMCSCFIRTNRDKYPSYPYIHEIIPEFTPKTFGSNAPIGTLWWSPTDRESRIKAFDKLIEIYSK